MLAVPRLRLLIALVVAPALAASLAFVAFSSDASADHSLWGWHWERAANPFTTELGDNVSGEWDQYLKIIAGATPPNPDNYNDWNGPIAAYVGYSDVLNPKIVTGGTSASTGSKTPKKCAATSKRVEVCNAEYGRNGWLGLATLWASNNHITQATTKLNDTYFKTAYYNTPAWKQGTICQEVGHAFGLDHQDESGADFHTCMDYSSSPDYDNMGPNQHDYDQLKAIYEHTEGSNTATSSASRMPREMSEIDTNDPRQWGKQIHKEGRLEVFERDFGQGHKVRTFVIRADSDPLAPTPSGERPNRARSR